MSTHGSESDANGSTDDLALRQALFPGLVYNQAGQEAHVVTIGGIAHYAIPDDGFLRHVEAYHIDNAVIEEMQVHLDSMRGEIIAGMLQMLGTDDILAKAAVEASLGNMGQSMRHGDPSQWAPMLRVYGFRIVVDVHGDVQEIIFPTEPGTDSED